MTHVSSVNVIIAFRKHLAHCSVRNSVIYVSFFSIKIQRKKCILNQLSAIWPSYFVLRKAKYHFVCDLPKWHGPFGKSRQLCFLPRPGRSFAGVWKRGRSNGCNAVTLDSPDFLHCIYVANIESVSNQSYVLLLLKQFSET